MTMSTLTSLLTDTLLYGEYKGVSEFVEPYITKERFDKIQQMLKKNGFEYCGIIYLEDGAERFAYERKCGIGK